MTVSLWRQCGAVPSAQVVAALKRHGCWLFSVELNNIFNSQSQGPAPGPWRSKPQGLGMPIKPLFHAYLHKCNRCTWMFYFEGKYGCFFIFLLRNMFTTASDILADVIFPLLSPLVILVEANLLYHLVLLWYTAAKGNKAAFLRMRMYFLVWNR